MSGQLYKLWVVRHPSVPYFVSIGKRLADDGIGTRWLKRRENPCIIRALVNIILHSNYCAHSQSLGVLAAWITTCNPPWRSVTATDANALFHKKKTYLIDTRQEHSSIHHEAPFIAKGRISQKRQGLGIDRRVKLHLLSKQKQSTFHRAKKNSMASVTKQKAPPTNDPNQDPKLIQVLSSNNKRLPIE